MFQRPHIPRLDIGRELPPIVALSCFAVHSWINDIAMRVIVISSRNDLAIGIKSRLAEPSTIDTPLIAFHPTTPAALLPMKGRRRHTSQET